MLRRIFLLLAVAAGLGSGAVAYYQWKIQIPAIIQQRDAERKARTDEIAAHNRAKTELKKTSAELNQTRQELADTQVAQQKQLARADAQSKRADGIQGKLASVNSDLETAKGLLAEYQSSGLNPDEVVQLPNKVKAARANLGELAASRDDWERQYEVVENRLLKYEPPQAPNPNDSLSPGFIAKVTVVDPKWNFVVLDAGLDRGVAPNQEMLISRQGKLVAKIIIVSVQKNLCVADLVPNLKVGEILEGDTVTSARPASAVALRCGNY